MGRRAFQIATAASFVFCLAVHIFWLRSHFYSESVTWENRGGWRAVRTGAGQFQVGMFLSDWSDQPAARFRGPQYQRAEVRPPHISFALLCSSVGETEIDWERAGFALAAKLDWNHGDYHVSAAIPCWFLGVISLILPAVWSWCRVKCTAR
jgi:hypothetical protein